MSATTTSCRVCGGNGFILEVHRNDVSGSRSFETPCSCPAAITPDGAMRAIVGVILKTGFVGLAADFVDRPESRRKIVAIVARDMARSDLKRGQDFARVASNALDASEGRGARWL